MITVIVSGIVTGFLYAIAGLGLVAVYRTSRVLNFALGGMAGLAVYFATELLSRKVPYGVVIVAALVIAALLGLLVEIGVARPLRRRPTLTVAIATLGVLLILQGVLEARYGYSARGMREVLAGAGTFKIGSFALSANQILIIALGIVGTVFLLFLTYRTRFGLTMRAASSGPQTSELLGVDLATTTRAAWMIGGAYGALAALLVTPLTYLTPSSFTMFLLTAFAAVVLGGFTSIPGVVIGALAFGVGTNLLETYLNSSLIDVYTFVGIALVLVLRPNGLFGATEHEVPEPVVNAVGAGLNLGETDLDRRAPGDTEELEYLEDPGPAPSRGRRPAAILRGSRWARWGLALVALVLLPLVLSGTNTFMMATAFATFIGVLGLNILVGYTGQVSLGQSGFLAIGAFTAAGATAHGVPVLLALVLAPVVGAIGGLIIGLPATRLSPLYLVLLTLTFSSAIPELAVQLPSLTGGANGLPLTFPAWLQVPRSQYWFVLAIAAVLTLVTLVAAGTRLGRGWRAVRDSEDGAKALGMRPAVIKLGAFAGSSALIALSGALSGMLVGFTSVDTYTAFLSIYFLLAVVLGGTGSIFGSLLGAIFITVIPQHTGKSLPVDLIFGIVLLAVLLVAPTGLVGLLDTVPARMRGRVRRPRTRGAVAAGAPAEVTATVGADRGVPVAGTDAHNIGDPHRASRGPTLLELRGLSSGYGLTNVLHGVSLEVKQGEVVVLIGANGVGKSTLLRTVSGILHPSAGTIVWKGDPLPRHPAAHHVTRLGIGHVPEGRAIFPDLSVLENLDMGTFGVAGRSHAVAARGTRRDEVLDMFPILRSRAGQRAGTLSGGEQQMLAIGRALLGQPELLMLDEPSLGLAPVITQQVFVALRDIAATGVSVLLVEQNAQAALAMADHAYVISRGRIDLQGSGQRLLNDERIQHMYLGVPAT